ncbi:DUF3576 domain-containing protein [Plastorhodobacter daqingensis]|uniref:DUF3576 domain-containing protein n=1 Tax=Plastorhodobacter daqingensis TaxID=1387281 RepID=A0ABW2UH47_9RHOB
MTFDTKMRALLLAGSVLALGACSGSGANQNATPIPLTDGDELVTDPNAPRREGILDLFTNQADANTSLRVNRYIWNASLDVLNFLPIESVDPFSGVIVTGFGTPPGGGRAYRATIYVQDPALDARSLKLALVSQGGGPVATETVRAVEDAILTRARQLRIQDGRL